MLAHILGRDVAFRLAQRPRQWWVSFSTCGSESKGIGANSGAWALKKPLQPSLATSGVQ